jgi:hypothetical protein
MADLFVGGQLVLVTTKKIMDFKQWIVSEKLIDEGNFG